MIAQGNIAVLFATGAAFGCLFAGILSERIGRLPTIYLGLFAQIGAYCLYFIEDYDMLLIARFVSGFAGGLSTTIVGPYAEELVPDSYKNLAKICFYVFIALSSTVSYVIGLCFGERLVQYWRWALLAPVVITGFRLIVFLFVFRLETPRYVMIKHCVDGQIKEEVKARKRIRNTLRR